MGDVMVKIVGIGEYAISSDRHYNTIKTFALASCVAVVAYNVTKRAAGMIHIALPYPTGDNEYITKPGYYATTGIPVMIRRLCCEIDCEQSELLVYIFGGANSINQNDSFEIGKRNIESVKRTLSEMNIRIRNEETGGYVSRTIEIFLPTGEISMQTLPIII
jgi:chemotaxis protein CheD